jgi:putative endonuclease
MENMNKRKQGFEFEGIVCDYLAKKGYEIRERNFYGRSGELDIVADEKGTLVFVEVKSKDINSGMSPFEAVDARKQKNIIRLAREYMMVNNISDTFVRFDVVGVYSSGKKAEKI